MTIIMENFKDKTAYLPDLFLKETGKIYIINRELNHPQLYKENEDFKKWLLNEWSTKDMFIDNYKQFIYDKIDIKTNKTHLYISIMLVILVSWLLYQKKEFRYFILVSMIISYLIVKFKKL